MEREAVARCLQPMIVYVLIHSTPLACLALVSYVVGKRCTERLTYGSLAGEVALSTTLGLGVVASLLLALGLLDLLYPWSVAALVALTQLACLRTWKTLIARCRAVDRRSLARPSVLLLAGIGLSGLFVACLLALYPSTGFDATLYHLPQARSFIENHEISFSPELRYPVFPHLHDVLFSGVLLFGGDSAPALVQTLSTLLVALGLYAWGLEFFSRRVGLWAAAVWLGNPLVVSFGSKAYVDVGLAAFTTMAGLAFAQWLRHRAPGWLALSGAFCGFAAATKYHGLFFVATLSLAGVVACVRQRRFKLAVVLPAAALLVALPWYARIYYHTGNPVFPFYSSIFGYSEWSMDLARMPYAEGVDIVAEDPDDALLSMPSVMLEKVTRIFSTNIEALLTVPWDIAFRPERLAGPPIPASPIYLFASPLLLLAFVRSVKVRLLLALVGLYVLGWFVTVRDPRYLLCVLGFLSLATAAAIGAVAGRPSDAHRRLRCAITAVVGALLLLPGARFAGIWLDARGPLPTTEATQAAYLKTTLPPAYLAIAYLNQNYGDRYRAYAINSAQLTYFAKGDLLGDWFGPYRYSRLSRWLEIERLASIDSPGTVNARGLYDELQAMGADFLIVPPCEPTRLFKFELDEFFHQHFERIFTRDIAAQQVCLWRVVPPDAR